MMSFFQASVQIPIFNNLYAYLIGMHLHMMLSQNCRNVFWP